jgi:hypothetical protein
MPLDEETKKKINKMLLQHNESNTNINKAKRNRVISIIIALIFGVVIITFIVLSFL